MATNFQIKALNKTEFEHLFFLSDEALEQIGAKRMIVDACPGYPCRVSLQDATVGEEVILFPYTHHKPPSPYQASGPIFIRKNAETANLQANEIPAMLLHRLLSLRGYDKKGIMKDAKVTEGKYLPGKMQEIFNNPVITYIHIHNAKPGCYDCVVERI